MSLHRLASNVATAYGSSKQGIAIGIENFVHLKKEITAGDFNPPSIGTQGKSTSDATPSTDISAGSDTTIKVSVDGGTAINCSVVVAGLSTGALIAAAFETAINLALAAANQTGRVWIEFTGGLYLVWSQKTGAGSSVVITSGDSNNVADDLKLGVGAGGVEVVGTAGGNFLFMTKCGLKVSQPFELSEHKSGRQASGIIKKKIMAEGDIEMYFNFDTAGGTPNIDTPVEDILENILGRKTVTGSAITFDAQDPPTSFLSIQQGNNVFGRSFNGGYAKSLKISLPGDGEAKITTPFKCRDGKYASISQVNGAVVASATVVLTAGEARRYDVGARVMAVKTDGRTVTAGATGTITVLQVVSDTTIILSSAISCDTLSYIVPWAPHQFDQVGIDNPVTGLQGSISLDGGSTTIEEIRSAELSFDPKVEDQDNYYGADGNRGRVVGGRAEITVDLDVMLSVSQARQIMDARRFQAKDVVVKLGDPTARHVQFLMPNVLFSVPDIELPEEGSVPLKLSGKCLQSDVGTLDAFSMVYV